MTNLKEKVASIFIPKKSPYCHHKFKYSKKHGICAKPCKFFTYKNGNQYCKLLKNELSIQDQIKDCGINEDYD